MGGKTGTKERRRFPPFRTTNRGWTFPSSSGNAGKEAGLREVITEMQRMSLGLDGWPAADRLRATPPSAEGPFGQVSDDAGPASCSRGASGGKENHACTSTKGPGTERAVTHGEWAPGWDLRLVVSIWKSSVTKLLGPEAGRVGWAQAGRGWKRQAWVCVSGGQLCRALTTTAGREQEGQRPPPPGSPMPWRPLLSHDFLSLSKQYGCNIHQTLNQNPNWSGTFPLASPGGSGLGLCSLRS